jgi:hypothetical protein
VPRGFEIVQHQQRWLTAKAGKHRVQAGCGLQAYRLGNRTNDACGCIDRFQLDEPSPSAEMIPTVRMECDSLGHCRLAEAWAAENECRASASHVGSESADQTGDRFIAA